MAGSRDWTRIYLWTVALCLFLALVGLHADIGSHLVAPRDAFWEPQHVLMYSPLLTASALTLGYLFWLQGVGAGRGGDAPRPPAPLDGVRVPFLARPVPGPVLLMAVGFFLIPAGGLFDQWWHTHLGGRETLYSLSHIFTIMGGAMAGLGVLLAVARAPGGPEGLFIPLLFGGFLILSGLLLGPFDFASSAGDYTWFREHRPPAHYGIALDPRLNQFEVSIAWGLHRQNGLLFPPLAAAAMLPLLALLKRMSSRRWAATEAALFYTAARGVLAFILSPETGRWPFLALPLPVLLPALVVDLWRNGRGRADATRGAAAGAAFTAGLLLGGTGFHPLGFAGAVAVGAAAAWLGGPVASLLTRMTPRQAVALVLLFGLAAPLALGLFDLRVRGLV